MKRDIDSLGDLETSSSSKRLKTVKEYGKGKIAETGLDTTSDPSPKRVTRPHPDTTTHDDERSYFDRPSKRRIEETGLDTTSDPSPKRMTRHRLDTLTHDDAVGYEVQSPPSPGNFNSIFAFRVAVYEYFESETNQERLWKYIEDIYEEYGIVAFAVVMHHCPQDLRLEKLATMDADLKSSLLSHISHMERHKQETDPMSIFTTIMTEELAREQSSSPTCMICQHGFCSANKKPVAIENMVKRACGYHMMHWACFRRKVIDGEMPSMAHAHALGICRARWNFSLYRGKQRGRGKFCIHPILQHGSS